MCHDICLLEFKNPIPSQGLKDDPEGEFVGALGLERKREKEKED